jgi:hypothetical protein
MPDDTEAAVLRAWLELIIKDVGAQAAAARRRVQAAHLLLLLLTEEESKATTLEQTATAARQRVPSSPSSASSLDTVVTGLHLQAAAVLNVRQLMNIVLDSSSTNYACGVISWSRLYSAMPYSSTSRTTLRPLIRG